MATATSERPKAKKQSESVALQRFKSVFETIDGFFESMEELDDELLEAKADYEKANAARDAARDRVRELEQMRQVSERSLMRFLRPTAGEVLPLFDQMEPADEEVHGENASEWRKEPIAAIRVSAKALELLTGSDIVLVGQLQDRVLENPHGWWEKVEGMNAGIAAAVVDGLNEFIAKRSCE